MEEAALLSAIAAYPDEDTPRLVYADWLDDHAGDTPDPSAVRVRAEFIRVQCELKKLEGRPTPELQRYIDLYRRQDVILTAHRHDLLGPLGDDLTQFDAVFDRGFVRELTLTAELFLRHVETVRELRPVPRIRLTDAGRFPDLILRPELRTVEALAFGERGSESLRTDVVRMLVLCPYFDRLEVLDLEGCHIWDEGLERLATSAQLPALIELDLSGNGLTDEGIRALVRSPLWRQLRRLVLGGNYNMTDDAADTLADAAATSRLENLNLRFSAFSPDAHRLLIRSYKGGVLDLY